MKRVQFFPSLIGADLLHLQKTIESLESLVDGFHLDVMDGNFVPNITWGPPFINQIAKATNLPLEIHLMVEWPTTLVPFFQLRPSDCVVFHIECKSEKKYIIKSILEKNVQVGIAISPKTPLEELYPFMPHINRVVLMSVNPGQSGQPFLETSLDRLSQLQRYSELHRLPVTITVDGGITLAIVPELAARGANAVAIDSAFFSAPDKKEFIRLLK